jgi:hypothetical protein
MSRRYRSKAVGTVHETMRALHRVGAIDSQTLRRFDDACLTPAPPVAESPGGEKMKESESYLSVWDAIAGTPGEAADLRARAGLMRQITAFV